MMDTIKIIFSFFIFLLSYSINAQQNDIYTTFRKQRKACLIKSNLKKEISFRFENRSKLQKKSKTETELGKPFRFGKSDTVSLNLNNSGEWFLLDNGDRAWRLNIKSDSAYNISVLYDKYYLPEGSSLILYDSNKNQVLGPYTHFSHRSKKPMKFATPLLHSSEITLEYIEPLSARNKGIIDISNIIYGFLPLTSESVTGATGFSGPCHVNINCSPEGDNWQSEKNGIAIGYHHGVAFSGSLVANSKIDKTPYFLTANHNINDSQNNLAYDAISSPDMSQTYFIWFKESSDCAGNNVSSDIVTQGAKVVANNSDTDFALLLLTQNPLEKNPNHTYFFNGWERNYPLSGGVCIHHPRGDIKKIATHSQIPSDYGNHGKYWLIYFDQTTNGHSVTEGGSSGSPLFNESHRIIGQLKGGGNINCNNPSADWSIFGRFDVSWTGGGNISPQRRLKDWLDPDNLSPQLINGEECYSQKITGLTINTNTSYNNCSVIMDNSSIINNSNLQINFDNFVILDKGFVLEAGSSLTIEKN